MRSPALCRFLSSSLVLFALASGAATQGAPGQIRIVGPGGGTFATIQDAVDAAEPGAVILVVGGTWAENVWIAKPLTLRGAGNATISVPTGSAVVVDEPPGAVVLEGFTLETQSSTAATVFYDGLDASAANGGTIQGCDIRGGFIGAVIKDCNATVAHNRFRENRQRGLQVNVGGATVVAAEISHNTFTGAFVVGGAVQPTSANGLTVLDCAARVEANTFENLAFGCALFGCTGEARANVVTDVGIGINVVGCPGFAVVGNTCSHEPAFSGVLAAALRVSGHVRLSGTTDALVQNNTLRGATINLAVVDDSTGAKIVDNVIRDSLRVGGNSGTGISFNLGSAQGAQIHGNDIESNETFAVHDFGGTSFSIDATGNWWGTPAGPSTSGPNAIVAPNVVFTPFLLAANPNAGA